MAADQVAQLGFSWQGGAPMPKIDSVSAYGFKTSVGSQAPEEWRGMRAGGAVSFVALAESSLSSEGELC